MPQNFLPPRVTHQPPSNINPSAGPRVALAAIVLGTVAFAAFSVTGRIAETADPAMAIHGSQKLVMPWHDGAVDEDGKLMQAKYRYKNSFGHLEDALPAETSPFGDETLVTRAHRKTGNA